MRDPRLTFTEKHTKYKIYLYSSSKRGLAVTTRYAGRGSPCHTSFNIISVVRVQATVCVYPSYMYAYIRISHTCVIINIHCTHNIAHWTDISTHYVRITRTRAVLTSREIVFSSHIPFRVWVYTVQGFPSFLNFVVVRLSKTTGRHVSELQATHVSTYIITFFDDTSSERCV